MGATVETNQCYLICKITKLKMYDYNAVNTFFGLHLLFFISNEQIWLHGNEKPKKVFTLLMHLLSVVLDGRWIENF